MNKPSILVVTGASGAGKTTAVKGLEERTHPGIQCFYFDQIGVPTLEIIERDCGGPEAWQADATRRWISRLAVADSRSVSVLDGQTRPSFVRDAVATVAPVHLRIVLLDCSAAARCERLARRGQPELVTMRMDAW